jgi:GGDEF domain-containing protein
VLDHEQDHRPAEETERRALPQRDELTGCLNYAALIETLNWELDRCRSLGLDLSCCVIAMAGCSDSDRRLTAASIALHMVAEDDATIGSPGRDEFVALLPGADADAAHLQAKRMCAAIRGIDNRLDPCARVAVAHPGTDAEGLLGPAHSALR